MTEPKHRLLLPGNAKHVQRDKSSRTFSITSLVFAACLLANLLFIPGWLHAKPVCNLLGSAASFPSSSCRNYPIPSGWNWVGCNTKPVSPMQYTESPDAGALAAEWTGVDHTTGSATGGSGFLVFDGPTTTSSTIWSQTISVVPGASYSFSAYVRSICTTCNQKSITGVDLLIGGTTVASSGTVNTTDGWKLVSGTWTAGAGVTSVTLSISIQPGVNPSDDSGNDGGLDDISFAQTTSNADFTYTQVSCNNPITFTSVDNSASTIHSWNFGDNTPTSNLANPTHQFPNPGTFVVMHTITDPCGVTSTTAKAITIESCCTCVADINQNMVTDGSFQAPCSPTPPYSSDYNREPCNTTPSPGWYVESNFSNFPSRTYCSATDHTPGGGTNFLVVDGLVASSGEARIWYQTGPLNNGAGWNLSPTNQQSYCFKVSALMPDFSYPAKPSIKLVIHACGITYTVATLDYLPYNDKCGWTTICGCWTPPVGCFHVEELDIVMKSNDCSAANDIVIDDIIFAPSQEGCSQSCGTHTQYDNSGYQLSPQQNPFSNTGLQEKQPEAVPSMQPQHQEGLVAMHPIPVPQGQDLHLTYKAVGTDNVQIEVVDSKGATLNSALIAVKAGQNDIIVKTDMLKPGSYILKAKSSKLDQSQVILVQ